MLTKKCQRRAGINSNIVPTPGQTATPKRLSPGSVAAHQLALLNHQGTPDYPLRIEPDLLYHGSGQRWRYTDCYSDRSFGGNFSKSKLNYIAVHFRDWPGGIIPGQFELVAQAAITGRQAVAQGVVA